MTVVSIPAAAFANAGSAPGWNTGKLTAAALATLPGAAVPTISGLNATPQDVFGSMRPSGDDLYLVTGFTIPYAAQLGDSSTRTSFTSRVRLTTLRNAEIVYTAEDDQAATNITSTGNATWVSAGTFTSDLINPIAIRSGERLSFELAYYNPWILAACALAIGVQIAPVGGSASVEATQAMPATIEIQELKAQA